jgi:mRNA interferase MazF
MTAACRGEVWLVDLGLAAKIRPCLVMSVPTEDADRVLVTVVPHTTALRGSRFEVTVSAHYLKAGGFDAQGIVTIPAVRLIRRLGVLSAAQMRSVEVGLCLWLGIGFV